MSLVGALDTLDGLTVTGITTSYAYNNYPGAISEGQLPALVINLFDTFDVAFEPFDAGATSGDAVLYVEHRLLYKGAGLVDLPTSQSGLVTLITNYLAALKSDFDLSGNLVEPLKLAQVRPGVVPHEGMNYLGCVFLHRWVLQI